MKYRNYKIYYYLRLSEEIISGSVLAVNRDKFNKIVQNVRKNDILITLRFLDLGRYYSDTYDVLEILNEKDVKVCILNLPYFNDWLFIQDKRLYPIIFELLQALLKESVILEKQNKIISTKLGMLKAMEEGKKVGHPKTLVSVTFKRNYQKYKSGTFEGMCLKDFCQMNGISKTCYYNWERKMKAYGEI